VQTRKKKVFYQKQICKQAIRNRKSNGFRHRNTTALLPVVKPAETPKAGNKQPETENPGKSRPEKAGKKQSWSIV